MEKKYNHEALVDGKPIPQPTYYVAIHEFVSEHFTIPCKSTVVCACYNKATAEWIKSLIMKAYTEYEYEHNKTEIVIEDDPFYLSDAYRDVKRVREYHTRKNTGYDLSYLSTIF